MILFNKTYKEYFFLAIVLVMTMSESIASDLVGIDIDRLDVIAGYAQKVSPLMVAVAQGDSLLVEQMLSLGASVDVQDEMGRTALYYAHDIETFRKLLDAHPNVWLQDKKGNTILHWILGAGLDDYAIAGVAPMANATDLVVAVQLLLEQGANPNMPNKAKLVPFDLVLLQFGKHQEALDLEWVTSFLAIGQKYRIEIGPKTMKLLNMHLKDKHEKETLISMVAPRATALKAFVNASYAGELSLVQELIHVVPDINELIRVDLCDVTVPVNALMIAAYAGHEDIVNLLVSSGANSMKTDCEGKNAFVYARLHPAIVRTLAHHCTKKQLKMLGATLTAVVLHSTEPQAVSVLEDNVKTLLEAGAPVNGTYQGYTPLCAAINNACIWQDATLGIVKCLQGAGADCAVTVQKEGISVDLCQLTQQVVGAQEQLCMKLLDIMGLSDNSLREETVSNAVVSDWCMPQMITTLSDLCVCLEKVKKVL